MTDKESGMFRDFDFRLNPEEPIYEKAADIPVDQPTLIFNGGHVKNQLLPYLTELMDSYGAVAHRVQARGREFEVYVGVPAEELFRWYADRICNEEKLKAEGTTPEAVVNKLLDQDVVEDREALARGNVDVQAARSVLFGFRQQIGQYFNLVDHIGVIEVLLGQKKYDLARTRLALTEKNLNGLVRQLAAGEIFMNKLKALLEQPLYRTLFFAIPDLALEYDIALEMMAQAADNLRDETFYRQRLFELSQALSDATSSSDGDELSAH